MSSRASVLLLCDVRRRGAAQIRDHVDALRRLSRHHILAFNPVGLRSSRLLDLGTFDAVAIHYSVFVTQAEYLSPAFAEAVRHFVGPKLQFIQDDYRRVDERAAAARSLGIDVLFTLYPEADIPRVWTERLPGVRVVSTLAGYVPDHFVGRPTLPLDRRAVEVGYRGREMAWWLGRAAVDKVRVGKEFLARARPVGLVCDIRWDEESRLYGREWEHFVGGCRTVLGTESGATITDFDGSVEAQVRSYLVARPGADFEEVSRNVLAPHEGNLPLLVISARMFEAAALRTPMILFPGHYSGVLEPERHYLPLAEDFSNFDAVAARVRDLRHLEELADRVYREIVLSGRYAHHVMVEAFDRIVDDELLRRGWTGSRGGRPAASHSLAVVERWLWPDRSVSRTETLGRAAVRNAVALELLARRPWLRRLLPRWRTVRRPGGLLADSHFAGDLIRLEVLRQLRGAADGPRLEIGFDRSGGALRITSRRNEPEASQAEAGRRALAAVAEGAARKILWDHSAVGTAVTYRGPLGVPLRFQMEHDGRYPFRALAAIAEVHPAEAAAALRAAWEPGRR